MDAALGRIHKGLTVRRRFGRAWGRHLQPVEGVGAPLEVRVNQRRNAESEFDSEMEANTGQIKTENATVLGRATADYSSSRAQTKQPLVRLCVFFSLFPFCLSLLLSFFQLLRHTRQPARGNKDKSPNKSKYKVFTFPAKPVV